MLLVVRCQGRSRALFTSRYPNSSANIRECLTEQVPGNHVAILGEMKVQNVSYDNLKVTRLYEQNGGKFDIINHASNRTRAYLLFFHIHFSMFVVGRKWIN